MDDAARIRGLLKERARYASRGPADRLADVDAELARLGHKAPETAAKAKPKRSATKKPPK